jgi:hypothetical protein
MATPTLTPGFTVLSTCEATTGWSGTNTLDTEVVKQGTNSLSATLRTNGLNTKSFTISSTNLSATHLRIWLNYASIGFLDLQSNGGIRLFMSDGTNTGYWYVGGRDTYGGGWVLLTVDTSRAFDSGSCTKTAVTSLGFALQLTGSPRNAVNTWWDYFVYGNGLTITGGTSGDPVTWDTVAQADKTAGYGVVQKVNGVYFVSSNLVFGSASDIYFEDTNQLVVFEDQPVNADLYKIEPQGSGTTSWKLTSSVLKSASTSTRFDLLLNNAALDTLVFTGNSVVNADAVRFKTGQSVSSCVFQGCNQIQVGSASFSGNTVTGSPDTAGALLWPDGNGVQNCTFSNNSRGIQLNTTGSKDFVGIKFSGNTFDLNNTSGSAITVNVSGGGTASGVTYTGSTVSVQSAATLTLTGVVDGSEVRIYEAGTITELYGVESKQTGVDPAYSYTSAQPVDIVIHHVEYNYWRINGYSLAASDSSLPISQTYDRNYRNPT